MLAPGHRVASFEIVELLASGGMGEVYRAIDVRVPRVVALKVLPADFADDAGRMRRFETEARVVADLSHPNIVGLLEYGHDGAVVFAAFELIDGTTLTAVLADGPLPPRKACEYGRQIASALAAAHVRGICHRDLKPDNVMVTPAGHVTLVDFGLARQKPDVSAQLDPGATEPGIALGTPRYMAPEQVRGEVSDARTDIYALGAVLYEMVAGRPPFAQAGAADVHVSILRDDPPPMPANVPSSLQRVILRCLEKSRDERYQSAADLAITLDAIGTALSGPSNPAARYQPLRTTGLVTRTGRSIVLTAAALALGAVLGWFTAGSAREIRPFVTGAYQQITHMKGIVYQGRFEAGSERVVYGASYQGQPPDVYENVIGHRESDARRVAPATLLAVKTNGDIAIARSPTFPTQYYVGGRLAVISPGSRSPDLRDDVTSADWAADGSMAMAYRLVPLPRAGAATTWRIEWPRGKVIHETDSVISSLRIAPNARRLAWFEHPLPPKRTSLFVAARDGSDLRSIPVDTPSEGLAWPPSGGEVWYTAARTSTPHLGDTEIRAVPADLSAAPQPVLSRPGGLRLLDIAPDGRVLAAGAHHTVSLFVDDGQSVRDLSWTDTSFLVDVAQDGSLVVFWEDATNGKDLFARKTDGSAAIKLLENQPKLTSGQLSPDGSHVVISSGEALTIVGIEKDDPRVIRTSSRSAAWLPDGRHLVVWSATGRDRHPAVINVDDPGNEQIIADLTCTDDPTISPTGAMACLADGGIQIRRPDGRTTHLERKGAPQLLIGWSGDERALYSYERGRLPASVNRIDLKTGMVTRHRELRVNDPSGVMNVHPIRISRDGRTVAYTAFRRLDELYVYAARRSGP